MPLQKEGASKFIKEILLGMKIQINPKRVTVGDFKTLLSPIDISSRQQNRETMELKGVVNQMNPTDIYRVFHLNIKDYMFFSVVYVTLFKINYIL